MKQAILKKPLALVLALLMVFSISVTSVYYASAIETSTVLTQDRDGTVKEEYIKEKLGNTMTEIRNAADAGFSANHKWTWNDSSLPWNTITPNVNNVDQPFIAGASEANTHVMSIYGDSADLTLSIPDNAPTMHVFNNQTLVVRLDSSINTVTVNYASSNPAFMVHTGGRLVFDIPEGKTLNIVGNGTASSFIRYPDNAQLSGLNGLTGGMVGSTFHQNGRVILYGNNGNISFSNFNSANGVISAGGYHNGLYLSGVTFNNNNSTNGGAIYLPNANNGTAIIDNCTFTGNSVSAGNGGAISTMMNASSGDVIVNGSTFTNNRATGTSRVGGAIYVGGTGGYGDNKVLVSNNTFSGNTAALNPHITNHVNIGAASSATSTSMFAWNKVVNDGEETLWSQGVGNNYGVYPYDESAQPVGNTEAETYTPVANGIRISAGTALNDPASYITYDGNQPTTTPTYTWEGNAPTIPGTVTTEIALTGVIRVTYSDGSTETVELQITVVPAGDTTVVPVGRTTVTQYNIGDTVEAASEFITNKDQLPNGTTYDWVDANNNPTAAPSTATTSSVKDYKIKVTYPGNTIPSYVTVKISVVGQTDSGSLNDPFDPESIVGNNTHIHMDADYRTEFDEISEQFELYLDLTLYTELENLETYNNLYFLRTSFRYNNEKYTPVVEGNLSTEMVEIKRPETNDLLEGQASAQDSFYGSHYTFTGQNMDDTADIYTYVTTYADGFTKTNVQPGRYELGTVTFRVNDEVVVSELADDILNGYTAAKDQLHGTTGIITFADEDETNRAECATKGLGSGWLKSGVFNDYENADPTQNVDIAFLTGNLHSTDDSFERFFAQLELPGITSGNKENVYWNVFSFQDKTDTGMVTGAKHHGYGMVIAQDDLSGGSSYEGVGQTNEFVMLERHSAAKGNLKNAIDFWNSAETMNGNQNTYGDLIQENTPTENMFAAWEALPSTTRDVINAYDNYVGYRTFYKTGLEATFHSHVISGAGNILYNQEKTKVFVLSKEQLLTSAGRNDLNALSNQDWMNIVGNNAGTALTFNQNTRGQYATTSTTTPVLNGSYLVINKKGALPYIQKVTDDTISEDKVVEIAIAKLKVTAPTGQESPVFITLQTQLGSAANALMLSPGDVAVSSVDITDRVAQDGYIDETDVSAITALQGRTSIAGAVNSGLVLSDIGFDLDDSGTVNSTDVSMAQTNGNDSAYNAASTMFNTTNSLDGRITVTESVA